MTVFQFIYISLLSTTAMSLFSLLLGKILGKPMLEPYWLNAVVLHKKTAKHVLGWVLHYAAGLGFLYLLIVLKTWLPPLPTLNRLSAGLLEGILGIGMWQLLFWLTHKPNNLPLLTYYINLLLAHIVFATVALSMF